MYKRAVTPSKRRQEAVAIALGRRIAELRARAGLTQEAVAEHLGSSKVVISRIETGVDVPSVQRLIAIADLFDVELRQLFDGAPRPADDALGQEIAQIDALLRSRSVAEVRRVRKMLRELFDD